MTEQPTWRDFLRLDDDALFAQCEFDRFRASGPGGQKRNVTESAVRLRHGPSGLAAVATESRSQHENRARALRRLRTTIALTLRSPVALEAYAPPTKLADALKTGFGRRDKRFLPAIAALFDLLAAVEWRVSDAARRLKVSTAALGRLLEREGVVLKAANERRVALGMRPLKARKASRR
jgi:hypothetical protein